MTFDISHLHHQQGMVRSHRTAAFGKNMRVWQIEAITKLSQHADNRRRVIFHIIVNRTGIARVRTIVINAQSTTDINMIERQAQCTQLCVITNGFAQSFTVIGDIRNLRAHVEVQQTNAFFNARLTKLLNHAQQLRRRQTKLGTLTTGISPFARGQGRQSYTQANLWDHTQLSGFFDD